MIQHDLVESSTYQTLLYYYMQILGSYKIICTNYFHSLRSCTYIKIFRWSNIIKEENLLELEWFCEFTWKMMMIVFLSEYLREQHLGTQFSKNHHSCWLVPNLVIQLLETYLIWRKFSSINLKIKKY